MNEEIHYDAILETYKKQEQLLDETMQEDQKVLMDFQNAEKCHEETKKEIEDADGKLTQKNLKFLETMQSILKTCEILNLTIGELKGKEENMTTLKKRSSKKLQNRIDVVKEVSEDFKKLNGELQTATLTKEITEYEQKIKCADETTTKLQSEMCMLKLPLSLLEYEIPSMVKAENKNVDHPKRLKEINDEINKIIRNLKNIEKKTEELEDQL